MGQNAISKVLLWKDTMRIPDVHVLVHTKPKKMKKSGCKH